MATDHFRTWGFGQAIPALETQDVQSYETVEPHDSPKPFAWTKTADDILERLASYLQRIPGAGH